MHRVGRPDDIKALALFSPRRPRSTSPGRRPWSTAAGVSESPA